MKFNAIINTACGAFNGFHARLYSIRLAVYFCSINFFVVSGTLQAQSIPQNLTVTTSPKASDTTGTKPTNSKTNDIILKNGKVLKDATIASSNPATVIVISADGVQTIPWQEMPDELQKQYNFNQNDAANYKKQSVSDDAQKQADDLAKENSKPPEQAATHEAAVPTKTKQPLLKYPPPEKLKGVFGLESDDCQTLFGRTMSEFDDVSDAGPVLGKDNASTYVNPLYPDWKVICVFNESFKCIEIDLEYTYSIDGIILQGQTVKTKIPSAEFTAWMAAVEPTGNWKGGAIDKNTGNKKWVNDKTKATAEIKSRGDNNSRIAILQICTVERNTWLAYNQTHPFSN